MYHVMSCGNRGERIYLDDVDRQGFIKTLAETCQKTGWQVHAYCLMRNHHHRVLEKPNANLVAGIAWLQSTYTIRLNRRHKLVGHLLSGRYKAQLVEGSGSGYLRTACDYVHLNPVCARLLRPEERLLAYPWSSLGASLAAPGRRPAWIRVDRALGEHGIQQQDTPQARRQFERLMEGRRLEQTDEAALKVFRRGWCLGSRGFREGTLQQIEGKLGDHHSGELRRETAEAKAERILAEELQSSGWTEDDPAVRRKSDPAKLAMTGAIAPSPPTGSVSPPPVVWRAGNDRRPMASPPACVGCRLCGAQPMSGRKHLNRVPPRHPLHPSCVAGSNDLTTF